MKILRIFVMSLFIIMTFTHKTIAQDYWPIGGSDSASAIDVFSVPYGSNLHFCYQSGDIIYFKGGPSPVTCDWVLFNDIPIGYIIGYNPQTVSFTWNIKCVRWDDGAETRIWPKFHSAPAIITDPTSQSKFTGESVSFSVTAGISVPQTIALPYQYQWQKNEINMIGDTLENLSIINLQLADSGYYRCIVFNTCGSDTSNEAKLTVNTAYTSNSVSVCQGQSYIFNGHIYTITGIYNDTLHAVNGNDSIVVTNLTVNSTYILNNSVSICQGQNYILNGHAYTSTGIYNDTLHTTTGCDSIIVTNLTVNPLPTVSITGLPSTATTCDAGYILIVNPPGGILSGTGIIDNTFYSNVAETGNHAITYSFTDGQSCTNSISQNILVNTSLYFDTIPVYDTIHIAVFDTTYVTIYDSIAVTDTLIIDIVTGTMPPFGFNTIKIYPNPTNDHVYIDNGDFAQMAGYTIKITNSLGQDVFNSSIDQSLFYLDLSTWGGNGTYFVFIYDPIGNIQEVRKIVLI